jgi:hypothetical protein
MIEMVGKLAITKVSRVFAGIYTYTAGRGSRIGTALYEAIRLEILADSRDVPA